MVVITNQRIKSQLHQRLVIPKGKKYKPRAGIILFQDQASGLPRVLIIKEKGGHQRWGFPKGGAEYRCHHCQMLVRRESIQGHSIRHICPPLEKAICVTESTSTTDPPDKLTSVHKLIEETVQQCAERELFEETGWCLDEEDQVLGILRVTNCFYLLVRTKKQQIIRTCPREILDYEWISVNELIHECRVNRFKFNFAARKIVHKIIQCLET